MRSRPRVRSHRWGGRRVDREVGELCRAVADEADAQRLTLIVVADLADTPHPSPHDLAIAVARRCLDDGQRSALAAYLHLVHDTSLNSVATVFGIDVPAARRLVERGSGEAPVTAGEQCRGWGLVTPRLDRTVAERHAASGHLALCRRCRNRIRAHATLEHRLAAAGSATVGASVAAAVGRALLGNSAGAATGALSAPIVALSTAAALTAGVGAVAVGSRHHGSAGRPVGPQVHQQPRRQPGGINATPAADSRRAPASTSQPRGTGVRGSSSTPSPRSHLLPVPQLPTVPGLKVPLPTVTAVPKLPLPTVTVSVPALPVPVPTITLPVPVPSVSVPPLP